MWYRLFTLIIKELQSLLLEPQTRIILIVPVLMQILLFPFAATLDVTNTTIAIYDQDKSQLSLELNQRVAKAKMFSKIISLQNYNEIQKTLDDQKAMLVVWFPEKLSKTLKEGSSVASINLLLDGRRSNSAQIAANYIQQIIVNYQQEQLSAIPQAGQSELVVRNWYNPNLNYKWFIVPSLIALIVTIGVLVVTALSIAREREQGTLEQLLVSPLNTWQIFIGKAVPAVLIAGFQGSVVLVIGVLLYKIPFEGNLLLFYGSMLFYTLSLIGIGLFISSICSTQQQAFIGVFVFMMPAILLSGYVSPVENMPNWLQTLTWVNPIRHFTEITKLLYLKGAGFDAIWDPLLALMIVGSVTSSIAYFLFRRNIA